MSSSRQSFTVSPLTSTPHLSTGSSHSNIAPILALARHLREILNGIVNVPSDIRSLADDLGLYAAEIHQTCLVVAPSDEYERALRAVRDDLDELERNILQYSSLLRRGWTTTIPNLQFARNCARLREQLAADTQAALAVHRRASATSTIFEEEVSVAIEDEEESRDVLTRLPPPVFVSKASRKWMRTLEDKDDQEHLWSPVSAANNMETAREGYACERREAMVRQIRMEDQEREETALISIMATPTVLSFSTGLANTPWVPKAMSVHHVEKSYFSPPPSSPAPFERKLAFVDTKGGVLVQTLPFLGVLITSVVVLALVKGTSSLILGFSLVYTFV